MCSTTRTDPCAVDASQGIERQLGSVLVATLEQLPIIRAVTTTIATYADFDLDAISDIKLAVDEAASQLIARARMGAALTCHFHRNGAELWVSASAELATEGHPNDHNFGWHVLSTLTDSLSVHQDPPSIASAGYPTAIEFCKRKTGQPA